MNADPAYDSVTDYQSAIDFLFRRIDYEKIGHASYSSANYRLDRMRRLLELLGNPHTRYPIVHVAGTKGKGTTSIVTAKLLEACGLRVGLYTSPHLMRLEERIQVNGKICSAQELVALVQQLQHAAGQLESEGSRPTFFEMTTAMGMLHFAHSKADAVVLEVGLGGRLDSTNVCQPVVSVITSISLDHVAQLGDNVRAIASEKAGIIKPNVPVVCAARDRHAQEVILQRAHESHSLMQLINRDFEVEWEPLENQKDSATARVIYTHRTSQLFPKTSTWRVPLLGAHQADNIAAAFTVLELLSMRSDDLGRVVQAGYDKLQTALLQLNVPARLQIVGSCPTRIIDTAHNPASIAATLDALELHFSGKELTVVFASSKDKDYCQMLELLLPRCRHLILTAYQNNPRALPLSELSRIADQLNETTRASSKTVETKHVLAVPEPASAWLQAKKLSGQSGLVCATGSFFLAAELLPVVGS